MRGRTVAVAYSGGRDSTALLHATLGAGEALGVDVLALHVHHGLSDRADAWQAHGAALCKRWARGGRPLRFIAEQVAARPPAGASIEAWARRERYAALRRMALEHGVGLVLLAQHRRDQAETFLLQALRGAGSAGLSAMPGRIERDGIVWARPWLNWPREAIEAYVQRHRLRWIDDDSNADARFARNRMRLSVWPQLTQAFAGAEAALAGSAEHAQEATAALAELAALDLAVVDGAAGLDVAAWAALSPARRSNALREWLKARFGRAAGASLVTRLLFELPSCGVARWPLACGELRLYRGRLQYIEPSRPVPPDAPCETSLSVRRAGSHALPGWGGALHATRVYAGGVALALLAHLELRPRRGAERFQAGPLRPPRSLKKQYQAAGIAAAQRIGPLFYSDGRLVYVPGLGVDARALAQPGQAQLALAWVAS